MNDNTSIYVNSELIHIKNLRHKEKKPFVVIFTDIDDTFFRKDRKEATKRLSQKTASENYALIAITGSRPSRIIELSKQGILPYFSVIIGAVGTEITVLDAISKEKIYHEDEIFQQRIHEYKYDRKKIVDKTIQLISKINQKMNTSLIFQSIPPEQYKVSLNFYPQSEKDVKKIREEFQAVFPTEKIVICERSSNDEDQSEYCLDIVPVTKSDAVQYVTNACEPDVVIVAGDSGNDADMISENGDVAIIVGGSKPTLLHELRNILPQVGQVDEFTEVTQKDGLKKLYYREQSHLVGPESILHALELLESSKYHKI